MRAALQNAFKDYNFDLQKSKSNLSQDSSDAEVEFGLDDPK